MIPNKHYLWSNLFNLCGAEGGESEKSIYLVTCFDCIDIFQIKVSRGIKNYNPETVSIIREIVFEQLSTGHLNHGFPTKLAIKYNLSRQRIEQITRRTKAKSYREWVRTEGHRVDCMICGKNYEYGAKLPKHALCSQECHDKWIFNRTHITIICKWCKREIIVKKNAHRKFNPSLPRNNQERLFCDKTCFGKWIAGEFGFKKKYVFTPEWLYEKMGKSTLRYQDLQDKFNLSYHTAEQNLGLWKEKGIISIALKVGRSRIYKIDKYFKVEDLPDSPLETKKFAIPSMKREIGINGSKYTYTAEWLYQQFNKKWVTVDDFEKMFDLVSGHANNLMAIYKQKGIIEKVSQNGHICIYKINYEPL